MFPVAKMLAEGKKPFLFFYVNRLREYLTFEMRMDPIDFVFDPERAIDDWVFLCFFVGNDFLPHLPSLEIREEAIDILLDIYKRTVPQMGGYLTEDGNVMGHLTSIALLFYFIFVSCFQ